MRALFVTSATSDVDSLVRAWDCWQPDKSERVTFHHMGQKNDEEILATARKMAPDIIHYIGACDSPGIPSIETFLSLKALAPLVNLCCDAGDWPWHEPIARYREAECFTLHVTLDGCRDAPVDLVTLTPVDPAPYAKIMPRTVRCGFSGGVSPTTVEVVIPRSNFPNRAMPKLTKGRPANVLPAWTPRHRKFRRITVPGLPHTTRDHVVWNLEKMEDVVTVRRRTSAAPYSEHVDFMLSCQMIVNTSDSGTGATHQIKGRVLEAGWAGCALLESEGSPIADWLPAGSYFTYRDIPHAKLLIEGLSDNIIAEHAELLNAHVKSHYHPRQIYGEILARIC